MRLVDDVLQALEILGLAGQLVPYKRDNRSNSCMKPQRNDREYLEADETCQQVKAKNLRHTTKC